MSSVDSVVGSGAANSGVISTSAAEPSVAVVSTTSAIIGPLVSATRSMASGPSTAMIVREPSIRWPSAVALGEFHEYIREQMDELPSETAEHFAANELLSENESAVLQFSAQLLQQGLREFAGHLFMEMNVNRVRFPQSPEEVIRRLELFLVRNLARPLPFPGARRRQLDDS